MSEIYNMDKTATGETTFQTSAAPAKIKVSRPGRLAIATLSLLGALAMPLGHALAETRVETVIGTVTQSDPIRSSYVQKTPKDERVCRTEDVPIYGEASGQSDLGAMIVGGLIGSAVGNKLSNNEGAGAAGTVAGAILGREHAKNNQKGKIIGYKQQDICETRTIMTERTIQEITGYRLTVEVDNKIVTLESAAPIGINQRVEISRQTNYSLR